MSGKDTRPNIKFTEDTGEEAVTALDRYKNEENLRNREEAVRDLLPDWAFRSPKEIEEPEP